MFEESNEPETGFLDMAFENLSALRISTFGNCGKQCTVIPQWFVADAQSITIKSPLQADLFKYRLERPAQLEVARETRQFEMELLIDVQALAARLLVKERYVVIVDGTQLGNIFLAKTYGTRGLIGKYFECFARSVEALHISRVKLS